MNNSKNKHQIVGAERQRVVNVLDSEFQMFENMIDNNQGEINMFDVHRFYLRVRAAIVNGRGAIQEEGSIVPFL